MTDWIYNHLLLPVLNVLYVPCDWMLGWTERFSPALAISIVGVVSGLAIILVQKYGSNQKFLGQCKADLKFLKAKIKAAKAEGRTEALTRARGLSGRIGGKYMWASLKPALWTVPLIGVIGLWTGSRLGYLPIRPGQEIHVAAHFEDQAKGFAYVLPAESFALVTPPISPIAIPQDGGGMQARWTLKAQKEGTPRITLRSGGKSYDVEVPVAARGGRPPDPVTTIQEATASQDQLQAIEIKLADSLPVAWWNAWMQWGGLYLVVAVGTALLFRWLLKVH
jgi:uncharacterized membrane protein (DUF106 family)